METYEEPVLDIHVFSVDDYSTSGNLEVDDGGIRLPDVGFGN